MEFLEDIRNHYKLSKPEMARGLGVNVRTYYNWLEGGVTYKKMDESLKSLSSYLSLKECIEVEVSINYFTCCAGKSKVKLK